jgi:uncharacterized MAPEG superfamily protein
VLHTCLQCCILVATSWVDITTGHKYATSDVKIYILFVFVRYLYKHCEMYTENACTVRSLAEWYLKEKINYCVLGLKKEIRIIFVALSSF